MKLRSPLPWFYLLVASLPFDRIPSVPIFGFNLRASLILGLIFLSFVAIEQPYFAWSQRWPVRLLYVFIGLCLVSALLSTTPIRSLIVVGYLAYVILIALAVSYITPRIKLNYLLISLFAAAVLACIFGLYQFIGDLVGLPLSATGLKPAYSGQVFGFPRIQAMSLEPLYFANYLLLPMSLLIGLGSLLKRSWLLGVLFAVTLFLTLSRGGVGGLVIVGILWLGLLLYRRAYRRAGVLTTVAVAAAVITAATLAFLVPSIKQKPATKPAIASYTTQITNYEVGDSKVDRAYTRQMAFQAFREHPLIGVGPGAYGHYLHAHNAAYPTSQIVNNEPAELLAETGLLGTGAFLAFAFLLLRMCLQVLPGHRPTNHHVAAGWALLFFMAGVAVQYYSFSTLYIMHIWLAIGLLLGTVLYVEKSNWVHQ